MVETFRMLGFFAMPLSPTLGVFMHVGPDSEHLHPIVARTAQAALEAMMDHDRWLVLCEQEERLATEIAGGLFAS